MDCRSCGAGNAPGRRYCRECGGSLGTSCPVCGFFNGFDDRHCGGCARTLRPRGPLAGDLPAPAYEPVRADAAGFGDEDPAGAAVVIPAPGAEGDAVPAASQEVSQSEIDGLFENILDEDEPVEGNA